MPKIVDHEQRRRDLGHAVWRVIRRDGVERASVRTVAEEAGWSAGALRHYFATQSELLAFAMRLVVERIEDRVAALDRAAEPRRAVEQVLYELLPLDDERRAENEVWLAFTARALIDPELRAQHNEVHDALHQACASALETLAAAGRANAGTATAPQAERLHALVDGLAVHTAVRPDLMRPEHMVAVIRLHLDALENEAGSPEPTASV
jgi:AcrR family transcriptional regulator